MLNREAEVKNLSFKIDWDEHLTYRNKNLMTLTGGKNCKSYDQ